MKKQCTCQLAGMRSGIKTVNGARCWASGSDSRCGHSVALIVEQEERG